MAPAAETDKSPSVGRPAAADAASGKALTRSQPRVTCRANPSRNASMLWMWQAWSPSSSRTVAFGSPS